MSEWKRSSCTVRLSEYSPGRTRWSNCTVVSSSFGVVRVGAIDASQSAPVCESVQGVWYCGATCSSPKYVRFHTVATMMPPSRSLELKPFA